jgi:ribosome biogenesis GTPase / thiamine phosphate phosphatase
MSAYSLDQLGWSAFYSQHVTIDELTAAHPARVTSAQRSGLTVLSEHGAHDAVLSGHILDEGDQITVGDWVLVERAAARVLRLIERRSLLARMAAGTGQRPQPIAANIDTLFVLTSCNQDFNLSRLERFLALALDAQIEPVIVLTKADLCANSSMLVEQARTIAGHSKVLALNVTAPEETVALAEWLTPGRTLALVGSSGVGKSTLINTLMGSAHQRIAGIRAHDGKGRHTTTARHMFALSCGAWAIDTPGMREIRLGTVAAGVRTAFSDVAALASLCRFRNCSHQGDTGCALETAVAEGRLDARRLRSYLKLQREADRAVRSERESRAMERKFGRMARAAARRKERGKRF